MSSKQVYPANTIVTMLRIITNESEAVHAVNQALIAARASRELIAPHVTDRSIEHEMATKELSHACNVLMSRIASLQRIVTESDQEIAGVDIMSLGELGLRAQTLAILLLLDELCDAMPCLSTRCQELFTGRLRTTEDIVTFLFASLTRINKHWLCYRVKPHGAPESFAPIAFQTTSSILYCSGIRQAQRAVTEIAADPDFARFLRAGSARTDSPQLRHVCDQLTDVLGIALTREPDVALFLAAAVLEPEELHDWTGFDDTGS